jgi:preprotein translocase subunit SecD
MHRLIHMLSAIAVLLTGCGDRSWEAGDASLSFYIVSSGKLAGGRHIDTPEFPNLGYIGATPDLVITQLKAVTPQLPPEQTRSVDAPDQPAPKSGAFQIMMHNPDAQKFAALTEQAIGRQVLIILGRKPLSAPKITEPITTASLLVTLPETIDAKVVARRLKQLTK